MIFFALVFEFNSFKNSINVDNQLYVSNISFPLFAPIIEGVGYIGEVFESQPLGAGGFFYPRYFQYITNGVLVKR